MPAECTTNRLDHRMNNPSTLVILGCPAKPSPQGSSMATVPSSEAKSDLHIAASPWECFLQGFHALLRQPSGHERSSSIRISGHSSDEDNDVIYLTRPHATKPAPPKTLGLPKTCGLPAHLLRRSSSTPTLSPVPGSANTSPEVHRSDATPAQSPVQFDLQQVHVGGELWDERRRHGYMSAEYVDSLVPQEQQACF